MSIDMHPVDSSQIHSVGYDTDTQTLAIRFKGKGDNPGTTYHYANVSQAKFDDFEQSGSRGKWFHQHVKSLPHSHPHTKQEE